MGLNFSFFGTPKKRVNYRPLYHDENEVLEERHARLNSEERKSKHEEHHVHGKTKAGRFGRSQAAGQRRRSRIDSALIISVVILITVLLLFFLAFYIAKSFGLYF